MHTVDATLHAALQAGTGTPFIKAYVGYSNGSVKNSHTTVWKYRLTGQTLEFWVPSITNFASDQEQIWLERGLTIAGTDYTITTGRFWIWEEEYLPNRVTRFKGGIVPRGYHSESLTTETYETVIDAFFAAFGKTTTYKDDTEAWLDYQFLPNPTELALTDAERMLPLLAQKRLIGCCDNGAEDIRIFSADVLGSSLGTITLADEWNLWTTKARTRQYLWKDELSAYHQDGAATDPVHNLGFMMSTDSPPARNSQTFEGRALTRPDLRWQDGDTIRLSIYGGTATATFFAKVAEEFDAEARSLPKWRTVLEAWPIFGNTEGGDLPQNVANRVNHAYVNPSSFDNVLSQNETNIQAALDVLDDHHIGGYTREVLGAARTLYVRTDLGTCTISNATPAVVTINGHGLQNEDQVAFFTTGALPTGLTAGTPYYVSGKTTNTFRVSATPGGAEIATSSAGSGTHSVATGSDDNDGLTTGRTGALFTPAAAITIAGGLDLSTYNLTIQLAKSKYLSTGYHAYVGASWVGTGTVILLGDTTTPSNVHLYTTWIAVQVANGGRITLKGLKIEAGIYGIYANNTGTISIEAAMDWAACTYNHMLADTGGVISCINQSYNITGSSASHMAALVNGLINNAGSGTVTTSNTPAFSTAYAYAARAGKIEGYGKTFAGTGATGQRYNSSANSVIFTNGGGANYFPGNVAGATSTGGQYL